MTEVFNKNTFAVTYRDDFAESDGYYRVLFNNGRLLQGRELNQLQTIIQTEMKRFADNIFKEGAAVNPGSVFVNNRYQFIKLAAATSLPSDLSLLVDRVFTGQTSGVQFRVIEAIDADISDPATLFVTYTDTSSGTAGATSVTVDAGETITDGVYTYTVQATNTVANPAVGFGTRVSVGDGSFYALGHFVFVEAQSKIVSKYLSDPDVTIGFIPTQDIVTVDDTEALYDNSNETPNITAPGADRYRIRLTLTSEDEVDSDENFVYVAKIIDGVIVDEVRVENSYNRINDLLALRTKEESGNYIAKRFILQPASNDSDASKLNLKLSDGIVYINGYRAAINYPTIHIVDKPRDTITEQNQNIPATYGNFIKSDAGKGLRNINTFEKVNLNDDSSYGGSVIGTARVRAFDNENSVANGVRYYLFDISMNDGESFRNAKSLGTNDSDYANIIQEGGKTVLYETDNNNLLFELPNIRPQSISDVSVTVQRRFVTSTDSSGDVTINLSASGETFTNTNDWIFANADSDVVTGLSVSGSGTQSATISGGPSSSSNFEIYGYVNKSNATSKVKTLVETTVTAAVESDGEGTRFVDLGKADIYDVSRIRETDSDGQDFTDRFTLDDGQRDNYYALGRLVLKGGYSVPTNNVFARFQHFNHSISGDFFSVNSYSGQVDYEDIPAFRQNTGDLIQLRNVLDFRPVQNASGTYSGGVAKIMELPEPSTAITADVVYYLPRVDVITIDEDINIRVLKGKSSFSPLVPQTSPKELPLFYIEHNPYGLNDSDSVVYPIRHKRYTMADIANLEKRIADVEETVTLSLLELDTLNLDVLDSSGNNRLKSGFMADNFKDFFFTDTESPEFRSSLDLQNKEMGPRININASRLVYDSDASSNTILKGDNVYMKYTETNYISQLQATSSISLNPYDVQIVVGRLDLSPSSDYWFETRKIADRVVINNEVRNITRTIVTYRTGERVILPHGISSSVGRGTDDRGAAVMHRTGSSGPGDIIFVDPEDMDRYSDNYRLDHMRTT